LRPETTTTAATTEATTKTVTTTKGSSQGHYLLDDVKHSTCNVWYCVIVFEFEYSVASSQIRREVCQLQGCIANFFIPLFSSWQNLHPRSESLATCDRPFVRRNEFT
jgi:hypothetical protein